jgi:uncharacterized protein
MPWVWVDLENTPHVLFLEPFVHRLRHLGIDVRITAKPQSQTLQLATARGLDVLAIGSGDFEGRWRKLTGGGVRALQLAAWAVAQGRPRFLLSSSRSAGLASWFLRVPGVGLLDYEHTAVGPLAMGATVLWLPDLLRPVTLPRRAAGVARFYPGLKENLYLDNLDIDRCDERKRLGTGEGDYLIVARPPASTAHYAVAESERLWAEATRAVQSWPSTRLLISPRNRSQSEALADRFPPTDRVRVLQTITPGPGLVAAADLVLGGGGTMNREAAVLGVPVWSTFCGPTPRIDDVLSLEGRLQWVRSDSDLQAAVAAGPPRRQTGRGPYPEGLATILEDLEARL